LLYLNKGEIDMRSLMLAATLSLVACGDKEEEDTSVEEVEEAEDTEEEESSEESEEETGGEE
tara:strand:+ start:432 stop:617 length:186 start_codon:yes stop_codon:yes gene_type:complete